MLQADKPQDFVLATGITTSIRDFTTLVFKELGIDLIWRGTGLEEQGIDSASGRVLVAVDPQFFRPAEVDLLLGDSTKARTELGWESHTDLQGLVREMVASDLSLARQEKCLRDHGFKVAQPT